MRERAHIAVDAPLIIVEYENELAGGGGYVVEPFQRGAAGECAIAHYGDDVVIIPREVARGGHAQPGRERGAGMPGAKGIVLRFAALAEPGKTAELADGGESVHSPGEQLVHIALVRYIEKHLVPWRAEYPVQRNAQLHQPQIGCQVAAGLSQGVDEGVANLSGKHRERVGWQVLDILRRADAAQQLR